MIGEAIKKIIINVCSGIFVIFACIGGYKVYQSLKPTSIQQIETDKMRLELRELGTINVAESTQKVKKSVAKGNNRFFRKVHHLLQTYRAYYQYDLNDIIIVSEFDNKAVIMEIDPSKLILSPLSLEKDEEYEESSILSPTISMDEIQQQKYLLKKVAENAFLLDDEFKELALKSLEEKLYNLARDLGFEQITVDTILKEENND